jgi:uncharacterized protein
MLHATILPLLPPLQALCQRLRVRQLYLFGSAVTAYFDATRSDVDALVILLPMAPLEQGETLLTLWSELEIILQRRVDLLTPDSLQNPFLKAEIERTKQLIYDAARTEIPV